MKLVAQGRRGEIRLDEEKQIAIKKAKDKNKIPAINKERQILLKLKENNINFVPKIIDRGEGRFSYQRIEGITMKEVLKITDNKTNDYRQFNEKFVKNFKKQLFLDLLNKAFILDKLGIIHGELIRPYKNIILGKSEKSIGKNLKKNSPLSDSLGSFFSDFPSVYIIDFERGKIGNFSGKNMKSFSQFLLSQGVLDIEQAKNIGKLNDIKEIYNFLKEKIEKR